MSIISTQGITLCQETPQTSITNQDLEVSEATSSSTLSLEWLTSYTTVCNHGNLLNCYRADYVPQKKSKAINRNNYLEDHHHFWNIHQTSVHSIFINEEYKILEATLYHFFLGVTSKSKTCLLFI